MDVLTAISAVRLANAKKIYKFKGVFSMKYVCTVCGWVYDEAEGYPEGGIPAGTAWSEVSEDFECPLCSVGKDLFEEEA